MKNSFIEPLREAIANDPNLMPNGPRTTKKVSYTLLAKRTLLSYHTIYRFMEKPEEGVSMTTLDALCRYYGMVLDYGKKQDPTKGEITLNS